MRQKAVRSVFLVTFVFTFFLFLFSSRFVWALTEPECQRKQEESIDAGIECWKQLLNEAGQKKASLQSEVARFDTRIALTTAQITQTIGQINKLKEEIDQLSVKIDRLDKSLDQVSEILIERIVATYKKSYVDPLALFFSSGNLSEFITRYKYLSAAQLHDKLLMTQMETVRANYEDQKEVKEVKQVELEALEKRLEAQKTALARQKKDREYLLEVTRNDEKRFQALLDKARAEREAILNILAGKGEEKEVGPVSEGQRIASIISGSSCNSSDTHLHFMVAEGGNTYNPFNYLKADVAHENCSGSSCGSPDGDLFNPLGSWNWPVNPPVKLNQGYGYTWAIGHTWVGRIYDFHNGIDIKGSSLEVKAVKSGKLYQGVYIGQGGCRLPYVRVDHDDASLDTYYLHVNF